MKTVGLTGGICSGKSTVARILVNLGAVNIDTDKIGHDLLKSDGEVRRQVIDTFGSEVLAQDGSIDRGKLADIVFYDHNLLFKLNDITHPKIYVKVKNLLEGHRRKKMMVSVIEAPLLPKAGWESLIDELWVTIASRTTILKRLKERGLSIKDSMARLASQMPPQEQVSCADAIINTDCSFQELVVRVTELWEKLINS